MRERMLARALLAEQPLPHRPRSSPAAAPGFRERANRQRRHPGGEIRVDRPAAVGAHRVDEEPDARFHDRAVGLSHPGQAHDHEAGQRRGFEVAAALGLHGSQQAMRQAANPPSQRARDRIARRREVMPHLPDRDQRRQRVAHDRQPQMLKPGVRHARPARTAAAESIATPTRCRRRACPSGRERSGSAPRTSDPCRIGAGSRREALSGVVSPAARRSHAPARSMAARRRGHPRQSSTASPTRSRSC